MREALAAICLAARFLIRKKCCYSAIVLFLTRLFSISSHSSIHCLIRYSIVNSRDSKCLSCMLSHLWSGAFTTLCGLCIHQFTSPPILSSFFFLSFFYISFFICSDDNFEFVANIKFIKWDKHGLREMFRCTKISPPCVDGQKRVYVKNIVPLMKN